MGRCCALALAAVLWIASGTALRAADRPALDCIASIRAVPAWSDVEARPVELEGVVTYVDSAQGRIVLQDRTGAIALDCGDSKLAVTAGQRVRLTAADAWPRMTDLPRYARRPDRREWLHSFETRQTGNRSFYVARFRGYLHPPTTGVYRLAIASDDTSELLLGTDESPATRRSVAKIGSYTRERDWTRTAPQRSGELLLEAGRAYYIEAVHQQAGGEAHLSVAWEGPGIPLGVVPGEYLSPWQPEPVGKGTRERGSVLREVWENVSVENSDVLTAPRKLESVLSVQDPVIDALGEAQMPEPVELKPGQPLVAADDFRWSATEGTVEFVAGDGERLQVELVDRGQRVLATVADWHGSAPVHLRGRRIRAVGVAVATWSSGGARTFGRIWLRPSSSLVPTDQAPPPELSRLTTIAELTGADVSAHRDEPVKLRGRVARKEDGRLILSDNGTFTASTSTDGVNWRPIGTPIEIAMPMRVQAGLAVNSRVPTEVSRAVFGAISGLSRAPEMTGVGAPGLGGRLTVLEQGFVVDGVGSDIWDAPDQFTFVHDPLDGEGSIVARLDSFAPADPAARAGIMIRESLAPDAQFVDVVQTVESGVRTTCMQWRWRMLGSGTRTVAEDAGPAPLPQWLKLERRFNTITVVTSGAAQFAPGDTVDVVGYVSMDRGLPVVVNAAVGLARGDAAGAEAGVSWRPLVEIGRLNDDNRKWGGFDYFRFRGVVTFCGDVLGRRYWAVQDRSAGTLLAGREPSPLFSVRPGSYVEVVSNPGWAPPTDSLFADNVFQLGPASLPEPVRHPAEYLLPKRGEGTWIELDGIVRKVSEDRVMEVKTRGEVFTAALPEGQALPLRDLVDAGVRLRGVIAFPSERERLLLVPSAAQVEVTVPPPRDPFDVAVETTRSLTAERLVNQSRHRILLKGTVTHADRDAAYVQDEFGAARVEFAQPGAVSVGDGIEAAGFPDWGEPGGLVLRNAVVRTGASGSEIPPAAIDLLEAAQGRRAGQLVRVRAVVSGTLESSEGAAFELEADRRVFRAVLEGVRGSIGSIPAGSLVEITGIAMPDAGPLRRLQEPDSRAGVQPVKLLLRGASDLVVLRKPSWWVVQRALLVVGFAAVAGLGALVWIQRLRRRVAQRTAELNATMEKLQKEARMSATLAERDRLAGEIHDSLEQGLNGLMLQLESTAGLDSCPPEIRSGLQLACNMASFSRTEVQNAVWELQSPMLEDLELPAAVEQVMRQIVPGAIRASVSVEGAARRLPSKIEHHLLRVAQEAINNTVKHASARTLVVTLAYGADAVVLSVADDGCGFVPGDVRTGGLGHFGLRSLRSRVARIGATIEIESAPGRGTTIRVRVPAAAT